MASLVPQAAAGGTGSMTLAGPATNSNQTLTLPDETGTLISTASKLVAGTAQNTTSGTSIDFTGIPSWAKRITVMFNGVSTNGSSLVQAQLGSGSPQISGYNSGSGSTNNTANGVFSSTGFLFTNFVTAADVRTGVMSICLLGSNTWAESHSASHATAGVGSCGGGAVTLSGALDRIRITTVNGTDTFDAGSVNIMWE